MQHLLSLISVAEVSLYLYEDCEMDLFYICMCNMYLFIFYFVFFFLLSNCNQVIILFRLFCEFWVFPLCPLSFLPQCFSEM